ncbi:MAG: hypothetical protein HOK67_17685 [Deltaproteobacteria bacterium]|nr:hypothetical protein [Deltaproteobacteria bacterium]
MHTVALREVKMSVRSAQQLEKLFNVKPVIVLKEMQKALDSASRATIFRLLVKVSYCRSYNRNGMYYTKHDQTRYDKHGLFSYKGIHFSRDGNLAATVARLIREASLGHTQRELQELLQVRVQTCLLTMVHNKQLARCKLSGQFIYLHPDSEIRMEQLTKRRELFEQRRFELKEVTDAVVIQVLLILIRYPGSRTGDVARRLKGHSPPITIQHVRVVFDRYNLDDVGEKGGPSRR